MAKITQYGLSALALASALLLILLLPRGVAEGQQGTISKAEVNTLVAVDIATLTSGRINSILLAYNFNDDLTNRWVLAYDSHTGGVVPAGETGVRDALQSHRQSSVGGSSRGADLAEALFRAKEHFDDLNAAPGSRIVLMTAGGVEAGSNSDVLSMGELLAERGWVVDAVTVGPLNNATIIQLNEATGGAAVDVSDSQRFTESIQRFLGFDDPAASGTSSYAVLDNGDNQSLIPFTVAPLTSSLEVVIHRELGDVVSPLAIIQPDGLSVAENLVVHSPYVSLYRTSPQSQPQPGLWAIRTESEEGLAAFLSMDSPVSAEVLNTGLPRERQFVLRAAATVNGVATRLEDATLSATLERAGAPRTTYDLVDDGTAGDDVAGDGVFAGLLPPLALSEEEVAIALNVRWARQAGQVVVATEVPARTFPEVVASRFNDIRVFTSGEWLLAQLDVELDGRSFAVAPEAIDVVFAGEGGTFAPTRLEPIGAGSGGAARFNVWGRPPANGEYAIVTELTVDHGGYEGFTANFASAARELTVSGILPSLNAQPSWLMGMPLWGPLLVPPLLVVLIFAVIKLSRRPRVFGYLLERNNGAVVELAKYRKGFLGRLFTVATINSAQIDQFRLEGITFQFNRGQIVARFDTPPSGTGLRLNGNPCPSGAVFGLNNGDTLGYGGNLITVAYSKPAARPEPADRGEVATAPSGGEGEPPLS